MMATDREMVKKMHLDIHDAVYEAIISNYPPGNLVNVIAAMEMEITVMKVAYAAAHTVIDT